ncbi:SMP-30/gluconolactonase/LRE family protein [Demequina sp. NBRC 110053]|uniref:SMP-30/gluconolactonase/LRE family protein n=1 Tax=Demequina sp. NBRC 110053 TaxID=1570342 RepID=UPI000A06D5B5|nr:SMP-30/gluconolactonase/LRE family protein [Demequina sp. NBRC 110053]
MEPVPTHWAQPLDLGTHELAEGPSWHAGRGELSWVDIMAGAVHTWRPTSGKRDTYACGQPVGSAIPREAGGFALALREGVAMMGPEGGLSWLARGFVPATHRLNDARCDARGRLWAGSMSLDPDGGPGSVHRVDPDGTCTEMVTGLGLANGMGWSPDGAVFYLIDSTAKVVLALDFDVERGEVSHRRTFVDLGDERGFPDGLAVDADGGVWVARYGAGAVDRFDARGVLSERVHVPAHQPTCPGFGGDDLRTLFITSARQGMDRPESDDGGLFSTQVAVPGLPEHRFAG